MDEIKTTAEAAEAAALPRCGSAHAGPGGTAETAEGNPLPKALTDKGAEGKSPAEWAYQRLVLYLQNFEEQLDEGHELAISAASAPGALLRIEGIGFFDPDLISFYGVDESGLKTQLVQHVTQLSVSFRAIPKAVEAEPPRRIGFRLAKDLEDQA